LEKEHLEEKEQELRVDLAIGGETIGENKEDSP